MTEDAALDLGLTADVAVACLVHNSLAEYTKRIWPIIEPGIDLDWSWHHDLICRKLEAVTRGDLKRLVINIPPGTMKSILVSVAWPSWEWLRTPEKRKLYHAQDGDLMRRDSMKARLIIESDLYRGWVAALASLDGVEPWTMARDQNAQGHFRNTRQGFRQCVSRKKSTGKRGDDTVVDDPHDASDVIMGEPARIAERMKEVTEWYLKVFSSRVNDKRKAARVVIQQRVHEMDLAGALIKRGWPHLVLPMEYEPDHPHVHPEDPRTEPGELLHPERFGRAEVEEIKLELGDDYDGQYQQRPNPKGGRLFKADHDTEDRRYKVTPEVQAQLCDEIAIFMDCSFKGLDTSDPVAIHVWGRKGPHRYLLDREADKRGMKATQQMLRNVAARWPTATLKLIEDKANGPGVIDVLGDEMTGVVGFSPDKHGSKWERAKIASILWEAGQIHLPTSENAPWASTVISEWVGFPGRPHDEDVDCLSMMTIRWRNTNTNQRPTVGKRRMGTEQW